MKTVCKRNMCSGCMACVNSCSKNAISIIDSRDAFNAVIDDDKCIGCGKCVITCPLNEMPKTNKPISWQQGWSKNTYIRNHSSSGGAAAEIIKAFILRGGYVCSCLFINGEFTFAITNKLDDARSFLGSKYVKSNPVNVYKSIEELLKQGKKVLFVGLPCQVGGIKKFFGEIDNLFTVDLICHGTPSKDVLSIFLAQHRVEISELKSISFRSSSNMCLCADMKCINKLGTTDSYLISFLNGLIYTEGCYNCCFARIERVSDITLGDNWATEYSSELPQGVSLILCQTNKGKNLMDGLDFEFKKVDLDKAIKANRQLSEPSKMPIFRKKFFEKINAGRSYDRLILKYYPTQCIRQVIKGIAIKLKLKKAQ